MSKKTENIPQTLDELIEFYQAIPEKNWCTGRFTKKVPIFFGISYRVQHCALGHLRGERVKCLEEVLPIIGINDGKVPGAMDYGDTPKQRVVNYLLEIKLSKELKSVEQTKEENVEVVA